MAGLAVRSVHPYLQDGALQGSHATQIDQLEAEAGDVVAKSSEQRVGEHRRCRKKNVGELPHIAQLARTRRPPGQR